MYVNNVKELRRALEQNQPLIQVKDEKFKAKVIKAAMKKGRLRDYNGRIILSQNNLISLPGVLGIVTETTIIAFGLLTMISLISLYAIFKNHDVEV